MCCRGPVLGWNSFIVFKTRAGKADISGFTGMVSPRLRLGVKCAITVLSKLSGVWKSGSWSGELFAMWELLKKMSPNTFARSALFC